MEFNILNQNEEITATLSTDALGENTPVYSATVDEKLGSYDVLELSIPAGIEHNLDIKEEYYIVFNDVKGFREYIITEVVDEDDGEISKTITAELSSIELLDEIIQTNLTGNNPSTILTNMLGNTRWTIGNVDASIYNSTFSEETEMVSVLEGINLLSSSFNAEVSFSYAVAGNKITKRFVNLHKQMGANNGKRFEVDKDVTSIKRTIDTSGIKTAIIPFGAESEGKARLNIKNLVWSKAAGNPVDKPLGQGWIGDPTALAQWGKNNADGSRRHRFIAQEINVETASELANMAWVMLGQYTSPKTTYEAKAMDLYTLTGDEDLKHEYVNLGDTVVITDYYFAQPLVVQSRVSELKRDLLEPLNNDLVFGDSLELFSTSETADRVEAVKKELSNQIEFVRETADGKSNTYIGSNEPSNPNEKDIWYRPHPTLPNETQFLIFNGLIWDIILDTSNLDSIGKEVTEAIEQADADRAQALADFETAKTIAKAYTDAKALAFDTELETVQTKLSTTIVKADKAFVDSETAIENAGFAKVDASTAKENAVTAITTANTAQTNAGTALTASQTAISNSGTALTNAQTALNAYNDLEIGGRNLIISSTLLLKRYLDIENGDLIVALTHTATDFISVLGSTDYILSAKNLHQIRMVYYDENKQYISGFLYSSDQGTEILVTTSLNARFVRWSGDPINGSDLRTWKFERGTKATDWTPAPEDVQVQIADINGELSRKVAQTTFDTLQGTVTGQSTSISQSQTAIALKADKTVVDTINSTVASHTLSIKATADSLATKAEKTLVDSINGTVAGHTSQIKVNADELALKADSSFVNTIKGTVDTHTTQIKATSDGLALKAESSLVNTINGTVNTHTGQISANSIAINARLTSSQVDTLVAGKNYVNETTLNATAGGLDASITKVSTDLSNLEVGGRNYFKKSTIISTPVAVQELVRKSTIAPEGFYVYGASGGNAVVRLNNVITGNGWWTVSFDIKGNQSVVLGLRVQIADLGTTQIYSNANNTYTRVSVTVNVTNYTDAVYNFVDFEGISNNFYWIDKIKVEKGNKATDWSLAPEDMATLEKFTTLNATVDGLQTTVGTKASQTQVTQLAGQITTKVESSTYNSKMTQLDSAINLRVQSGDVTVAILNDKKTKDTRGVSQLPSWYLANYPMSSVSELKERTIMGAPGTAYWTRVTSKLPWIDTGAGGMTQTLESSDGTFTRMSNSAYTAWLVWDKVAETGKLISQINISTEGILLQGKRIQLDGDVTMTTAFVDILNVQTLSAVTANIATVRTQILTADIITSTHLKSDTALITKIFATDANVGVLTAKTAFVNSVKAVTISADKVTTGTLNAANVNIVNLNVSNLVGNTSDFVKSAWNNSAGGGVTITGGGIQSTGSNGYNALLQNGVLYIKDPEGRGVGTVGGATTDASNTFSIDIINPNNFMIRETFPDGRKNEIFSFKAYLNKFAMQKDLEISENLTVKKDIFASQTNIYDVNFITFGSGQSTSNSIYSASGGYQRYAAPTGFRWDMGGSQSFVLARSGSTNYASMYAHLNMQGYNITNQSDRRLKTNIINTNRNVLDAMRKWNFVEYEWIDSTKPSGNQFGLIAQDTPELITFQEHEDYYGIDSSRQIMLNSKGIQELIVRTENQNIKFIELEEKYELLKNKIEKMENEI